MTRLAAVAIMVPLLAGGIASAQQTISVRTLALRECELPGVHLKGTKEHLPLEFSAVQPGVPVRALAANPLPLYRSELDARGNQAWVVDQRVKLPAGARGILLLGWTVGDEPRYVAINDDFAAARYNDWLLINASSRPVAFKVGDKTKPVMIAPGGSASHRISAPRGQGAAVLAQAPINGKPTVFYSTYWPVYQDRRTVVLFADDGPKIAVKRISDSLAPAKPPPQAD